MAKASPRDRAYFARLARANRALVEEPPSSLDEALTRMELLRRNLGAWAAPGLADPMDDGDLEGHLRFLAHLRAIVDRGT
jgi:hypothetical protein